MANTLYRKKLGKKQESSKNQQSETRDLASTSIMSISSQTGLINFITYEKRISDVYNYQFTKYISA